MLQRAWSGAGITSCTTDRRGVLIHMRRALVSCVRVPVMVAWAAVTIAAPAGVGFAQESRAALIAAEQTKKAASLTTRVPSAAERTFVKLQQEFMQDPNGFYPWLGSV